MHSLLKRKLITILKDPIGGVRNNYHLFRNQIWPSACLSFRKRLHTSQIPSITAEDQGVVDGLNRHGYWVTHMEKLFPERVDDFMAIMDEVFSLIDSDTSIVSGKYLTHVDTTAIEARKELVLFGLSERILNIVENYIGLPVYYRGLTVRRDFNDSQKIGTRLWHKDFEDFSIVKVIVYACDVGEETGPFEIVDNETVEISEVEVSYSNGRVDDEEILRAIPKEQLKSLVGKRGTIIFADTAKCFHRGKMPLKSHRDALFFAYNSTRPRSPAGAGPLLDAEKVFKANELTARQWSAAKCPY